MLQGLFLEGRKLNAYDLELKEYNLKNQYGNHYGLLKGKDENIDKEISEKPHLEWRKIGSYYVIVNTKRNSLAYTLITKNKEVIDREMIKI